MSAAIYDLAAARARKLKRDAAVNEARTARAIKIIKFIDGYLRRTLAAHDHAIHAKLYQRESAWVLSELKSWSDAQWCVVGFRAGLIDFPSLETRQLIIAHYEWAASNCVEVRVSR